MHEYDHEPVGEYAGERTYDVCFVAGKTANGAAQAAPSAVRYVGSEHMNELMRRMKFGGRVR